MKAMLNKKALIESAQKDNGKITIKFSLWQEQNGKLQYEKDLSCTLSYEQLLAIAKRLGKYE